MPYTKFRLQRRAQPRKLLTYLRSLAKECKHFSSNFDATAWPYGPKNRRRGECQIPNLGFFENPNLRFVEKTPERRRRELKNYETLS